MPEPVDAETDARAAPEVVAARRAPEQARSRSRVEGVLDTAAELIAREGIDAMTMSQLAHAAGVSLPSIYRYFPNKQAILRTLMARYSASVTAAVVEGMRPVETLDEGCAQLSGAMHRYWRLFRSDAHYAAVWSAAIADPELRNEDLRYATEMGEMLLASVRHVMPPDFADGPEMAFLLTYLSGAVVRLATVIDPAIADRIVHLFADRIVPTALGLQPSPPAALAAEVSTCGV